MKEQIAKTYDAQSTEEKHYERWEKSGYFQPRGNSEKHFTIVMPPPNVTGQLHIGHALNLTWQDILTRYHRQIGDSTLYIPGTDHAGIATQRRVRDQLEEQGIDFYSLTREEFLDHAWKWKEEFGSLITEQARKMGISCDWSRERFTMDEGCNKAVLESFVRLYERDLIYKGNYIVNYCPSCGTTLSDIEVEHEDEAGKLYYLRYPLADEAGEIVIATTRPETILADVAVAVHPEDERYASLIGKECLLPLLNRRLPIIADAYVEKEFGTGALKITPGHDPNDFLIGERHNLPQINILTDDAYINEQGGPYAGLERYEARRKIVEDLQAAGFLIKIEDHAMSVGKCTRCGTVIEPLIKSQWFVRMEEMAQKALAVVEAGEIRFIPARYERIYSHWLENIHDWCISRQLYWGHRIPAYYCECGETIVSAIAPTQCPKCQSKKITQDEDVLDTWFSSALWPFSTQGWPEKDIEEIHRYPTTTLVTAYDIILFWVVRMVSMGMELTGKIPFYDVLIHGLVRDSLGRKMSKSLGNGIDPLEVIEEQGADALRFSLILGITPGNDIRFQPERLELARNFTNKLWNAARFIQMNLDYTEFPGWPAVEEMSTSDRWIVSAYEELRGRIGTLLERYEFGEALRQIYEFLWSEFCDWYIEMSKPRLYSDQPGERENASKVLLRVFSGSMQLLHPFMPFITEELYLALPHPEESIMIAPWPEAAFYDAESLQQMETVKEAIRIIRNIRHEADIKPGRKIAAYILAETEKIQELFEANAIYLKSLANISDLHIVMDEADLPSRDESLTGVIAGANIYLPLAGAVDLEQEAARMADEIKRLQSEVARARGKLANENFTSKAPPHIVEEERVKLFNYESQLAAVEERAREINQLLAKRED